ncbi:MAG: dTDP-4-dehydrorhamnose reductase [Patescibacteria group bacterium]
MKILVTGANGQLGSELREKRDDRVIFVDRDELDITDADAVDTFFTEHKPNYCINAAAYTNVEKAEDEYEICHAVNAQGAENIARACTKQRTILFHISTDFVFDGKKNVPYAEDDEPNPLGAYAKTKYEGECAVQERCPRSFIVRTAWLYSPFGGNFVKTILRLCAERDSMSVVADQYGSPTYARDMAEALMRMVEQCEEKKDTIPFGIYHYANDGEVTWFEFAQKIRDLAGLSCDLLPIPASEYPSRVERPSYSVLATKKIQYVFGVRVPEWDESLVDFFKRT